MSTARSPQAPRDRKGRVYKPAIGPRLKVLLWIVLGGVALLGANSVYLAGISALEWYEKTLLKTPFYISMFGLHLLLGLGLMTPFLLFAFIHLATAWKRPNKGAVRYGLALLTASLIIVATGLILVRLDVPSFSGKGKLFQLELKDPLIRRVGYWLHVLAPVFAVGLYIKHRMAGPRIKWGWVRAWAGSVAAFVVLMGFLHSYAPRPFGVAGSPEGQRYFFPSEALTEDGNFIPARALMMDEYCLKCHKDVYESWFHSSHHMSSFNNPYYLASVRETRQIGLKRDGDMRAARWCAGCHDPVPFFSGKFDDPKYDDVNDPTSQAGITCLSCHAITHVNSTRGNGDYTIKEPVQYAFAYSSNPVLQWINNALVKAKPELHKASMLKPLHKTAEFCSTCHKVGIPYAVNEYKDFVRGQDHYNSYELSGVGHGARSFYYPPKAQENCAGCHMERIASEDFGAKRFEGLDGLRVHDHMFASANTGLAFTKGDQKNLDAAERFLKNKAVRIDIFALREGATIDGTLLGPIRPQAPTLKPDGKYLVETVVRTLGLGHPFSQGTADSNEIWVELIAKVGNRVIGRSGGIGRDGTVDPYSHFINIYMLDKDGNRIDRRNPQDIFVPLYNKQVPPGAGQVVHFELEVPRGTRGPIELEAKVNYRKFDRKYLDFVFGVGKGPKLPVVVMARDSVKLAVDGGPKVDNPPSPIKEGWQRWNDYGIGLFLEGPDKGSRKGELKQAEDAFKHVVDLGAVDGWVNLARVYQKDGRVPEALDALTKAAATEKPAAPWVINWLTGQVNEKNGLLDDAIKSYESILNTKVPSRNFDFSGDYVVIDALANVLYQRARQEEVGSPERLEAFRRTLKTARKTIALDSEDVTAHYILGLCYSELSQTASSIALDGPRKKPVDAETLLTTIKTQTAKLAEPTLGSAERAARAHELAGAIFAFRLAKRPKFSSKLEPLHEVVARLSPVWDAEPNGEAKTDQVLDAEPNGEAKAELAQVLALAHQSLHSMLKPDENAEGRAVRKAKEKSKAANQNSQSIVIHSLHRPGAPGITSNTTAIREKVQ